MTGLSYGIAADDIAGDMAAFVLVATVQLPSHLDARGDHRRLVRSCAVVRPVAWGVLVAFVAIYLLGSMAEFPRWLLDLVPFTHTQHVPGAHIRTAPVMWRLLLDAALIAIGLAAFRRRDLR